MSVSLLQMGALAIEPAADAAKIQAEKQIKGGETPLYYAYNEETGAFEAEPTEGAAVTNRADNPSVTISKEISATGEENVFDIDLTVTTTEAIEESSSSPDAAVVLVMDVSTSMDWCANHGHSMKGEHCKNCGDYKRNHSGMFASCRWYQKCTSCGNCTESRLKAAKDSAKEFLRSYAGFKTTDGAETYTDAKASRYVSIVAFSNGNRAAGLVMDWTDLHGADEATVEANLTAANNKIDVVDSEFYTSRNGTNPDAGLKIAQNQLTTSGTDAGGEAIAGVDNKFLVLLSDGEPNGNTGNLIGQYPAGYTPRNDKDYDNPAKRAYDIRNNLGTTFYSISFGAGGTVSNWMSEFSNKCVDASDSSELEIAFREIIVRLMLAVDAWKVTDPMGSHISLKSVTTTDHADAAVTQNGNELLWNLRADLKSPATVIKDENGNVVSADNYVPGMNCTITYHLNYQVKLDVAGIINAAESKEAALAALEEYYRTNGETKLDYYLTETNEQGNVVYVDDAGEPIADGEEKMLDMYFKVPAVKGYAAQLEFTKTAPNGSALQGAQFTLTNEAGTWSDAATSGADGKVTFTKLIPSGESYTLTETAAPDGYEAVSDETFALAYGAGLPGFAGGELEDPVEVTYTNISFTKTWLTPGGMTPDSITVTLKQNGKVYEDADGNRYEDLTIRESECQKNGNGVWTYTFLNLPEVDEKGNAYTYTVEEAEMEGYTTAGNGTLALTNTASGKVNIMVAKDWLLPDTMTTTAAKVDVILLADGVEVDRQTNIADGQTAMFLNKEKYNASGREIIYSVAEESDAAYQQVEISKDMEAGPTTMYTIVNTVAQEYNASVSGTKTWKDGGDESARPASITVQLYADGVAVDGATKDVTAADNWQYTFPGLQRYNFVQDSNNRIIGVEEIVYTVQEVGEYEGYTSSAVGADVTNTRTGTVSFTVVKDWDADLEGAQHGEVTAVLYANGHPVDEETFTESYTFENLPKYDADGVAIRYDAIEKPVEGYTPSYGTVSVDDAGNYTQIITNRRDDADDTVTVTVTKIWKQPGDIADQTATFQLYADGEIVEGQTLQITGNGVGTFRNLDRYRYVEETDTLEEVDYDVEEIDIPRGYENTVEEELTPDSSGNFTCNFVNTITGTTDVEVSKRWVKPGSVAAPDIAVSVQSTVDGANWTDLNETIDIQSGETSGKLSGLPAYDDDGRRISYRVTELSVPNYSSAVSGGYDAASGNYVYDIVNTINPADTTVSVKKVWIDGGANPADRPSVTLELLQSGMVYDTVEFWYDAAAGKVMATTKNDTVEATVDGNTYSVNLTVPVYSSDLTMKYTYVVTEGNVPAGYTATVNGTTATNKRAGTLEPVTVTKYWTDPAGTDRPDITLVLTGTDGSVRNILVSDDGGVVATLDGRQLDVTVNGSTWSVSVPDLPEFDASGARITYTLDENDVPGYTKQTVENQPLAIRNVITQESDVSVGATKVWANMDAEGVYTPEYPESITVALFRDGMRVEGSEQVVSRDAENAYTIQSYTDLDKYAPDGHVYDYQVMELDASGNKAADGSTVSFGENNEYTVSYQDGVITNTYKTPAKYMYVIKLNYVHMNYDGTTIKSWGTQTERFTETESKVVSADPDTYKVCKEDGLTYDLDNSKTNVTSASLDQENHLYTLELNYILEEEPPERPTPPTTNDDSIDVTVRKVWKGDDEETRPESITVQLLRDGEEYDTHELNEDNGWKFIWVDLDESDDWTVEELDVPDGYTAEVKNRGNSWTITNTLDEGLLIPEEPVPGSDQPNGGDTEILDGDVPLGAEPDELEIPDSEVPLAAQPPKTGDAMGLWAVLAAMSGTGLGWMTIGSKKREEEEN